MLCRAFATISRIIYSAISTRLINRILSAPPCASTLLTGRSATKPEELNRIEHIQIRPCKMCVGAEFYAKKVSIVRCIQRLCDVTLGEPISQYMTTSSLAEKHKSFHFLRTCGTNYSFLVYRVTFATNEVASSTRERVKT